MGALPGSSPQSHRGYTLLVCVSILDYVTILQRVGLLGKASIGSNRVGPHED